MALGRRLPAAGSRFGEFSHCLGPPQWEVALGRPDPASWAPRRLRADRPRSCGSLGRVTASVVRGEQSVRDRDRGALWWALTCLATVGAIIAVALLQRRGLAASPDGAVYLGVGDNLRAGRGLTVPFTGYTDRYGPDVAQALGSQAPLQQWPPLLPAVLAALGLVGLEPAEASRVLNPALAGVSVYLFSCLLKRWSGAHWAPLLPLGLALVLVRPFGASRSPLLALHTQPLAEPLFIALVLTSLLLVDTFLSGEAPRYLWLASLAASFAALTKVVGLSMVLTVALVGVASTGAVRPRVVRAGGALIIGVVPLLPTLLNANGGRTPVDFDDIRTAFSQMGDGLLRLVPPETAGEPARAVGAAIWAIAIAVLMWRAVARSRGLNLWRLAPAATFCLVLLVQLLASNVLVDRFVSLDGRQVTVIHLLAVAITVALLAGEGAAGGQVGPRLAVLATAAAIFVPFAVPSAIETLRNPPTPESDDGYSEAVDAAGRRTIFTSAPDRLYVATGATSHLLPCPNNYYSGRPNTDYQRDVERLRTLIRDGEAVAIVQEGRLGFGSTCAGRDDFAGDTSLQIARVADDLYLVGVLHRDAP